MAARVMQMHPNFRVIATTLRQAHSANRNDWGAFAYADGKVYPTPMMAGLEILDRVGAGDAFAAGFIYGLLNGKGMGYSLECGLAHGALTMTTTGDSSYATLAEVENLMADAGAHVQR